MTRYYTYRDNVPLLPGQTLGFTSGRGYYARGTPTPTQATKNTTAYREPKTPPPPKPAPLPGSKPATPVDRPGPPKPAPAPLPGSTPSTPVDRPDAPSPAAVLNATQPTAAGKTEPAPAPSSPMPTPAGPSAVPPDITTPSAAPSPPAGPSKPEPPRAVGPLAGLLDGSVYVAAEGTWHHIPDADTFNALGLDWNAIAWYGTLPGDVGDPIEPLPPDAGASSAGLTPPLSTARSHVTAKPARPRARTGARRTPLSASGSKIGEPPPPIVVPVPSQQPGSVLKKPGQMVILPTTVRRENVKFTILSGKFGQVRVKVEVVREPFKPPGLTTVTVRVDGKLAGDPSHPIPGNAITVDASVGQTISVRTTTVRAPGKIDPKFDPPDEGPGDEVKPGWPSMGIDLKRAYPGELKHDAEGEQTPVKVRVVSHNGVAQLK